jgi:hypothetical protein
MPPHLGTLCPSVLEPVRDPQGPSAATASRSTRLAACRAQGPATTR